MKTTVEIEDNLLKRAKRHALDNDMTLRQTLEAALEAYLKAPPLKPMKRQKWKSKTFKLETVDGVDLSNWEQIRSLIYGDRE